MTTSDKAALTALTDPENVDLRAAGQRPSGECKICGRRLTLVLSGRLRVHVDRRRPEYRVRCRGVNPVPGSVRDRPLVEAPNFGEGSPYPGSHVALGPAWRLLYNRLLHGTSDRTVERLYSFTELLNTLVAAGMVFRKETVLTLLFQAHRAGLVDRHERYVESRSNGAFGGHVVQLFTLTVR